MKNRGTFAVVLLMGAFHFAAPEAHAQGVPPDINHQSYIEVNGRPFDGNGSFRFALVDGSGNNVWTHDGSALGGSDMPGSAISLVVSEGIYEVALGNGTTTDAFPSGFFASHSDLRLRVWFDDGENGIQQLTPDKPLRSAPYARQSAHANTAEEALAVPNVITVDRVEYASPRTHVLTVPASAFRPRHDSVSYSITSSGISLDPGVQNLVNAPVALPDGATLQKLTLAVEDNDDDSDVAGGLGGIEGDGNGISVALFSTNGITGDGMVVEDLNHTVLPNAAYTINLRDDDWEDMTIRWAKIEYTITEAP